ncbi:unnamed protein product [Fraxinus pennsylvanica]|uniref:Uncharacterized protein n=1 Tax=Fraxinus pennsylvanica TaxID=56036 RepID=A0AAD2AHQ6_9LAMI|nr:unnamed protein product [Fraxinus pennsylvanica]
MDFLNKLTGKDEKPTSDPPKDTADHPKPSNSDLMGSVKVLADAAKEGKFDNPKAAAAAADVLGAAEQYGKLDETKGIGQYVDKAEDYLHQYSTTHSSTANVNPDKKSTPDATEPPKNT